MQAPSTGFLDVGGRALYIEEWGQGDPLVVIPPGNGDASPFRALANCLMHRFRIISFDRAGYSRSQGPVAMHSVEEDASDAISVLKSFGSGGGLVGGSSAGVIALACAARNDPAVRFVAVHEAPLVQFTDTPLRWRRFYEQVYAVYQQSGPSAAYRAFRNGMELGEQTRPSRRNELPSAELEQLLRRVKQNRRQWFEQELLHYPRYLPNLNRLRGSSTNVFLAGGVEGAPMPREGTRALAHRLDEDFYVVPGGHVPYITHPDEFATWLTQVSEGARR